MNKYLEKIAEQKDNEVDIGRRIKGAIGGLSAGVMTFGSLAQHTGHKVMKMIDDSHSYSNLGTIKKMMRDNNLNTTFNNRSHNIEKNFGKGKLDSDFKSTVKYHKGGPGYMPNAHITGKGKNFIVGVKNNPGSFSFRGMHFSGVDSGAKKIVNKDVIMHELGHAKDFMRFGRTKTVSNLAGSFGGALAPALLLNKHTEDYAVPVAALSVIPTLRSEAAANYHAYKGIKAHQGAAAAKGFAKKLLPHQMGTYGLQAAMVVGGTYAGKKIIDHMKKK